MAAKYDTIGINYNHTRKADPYLASRMAHHLDLKAGGLYLDIGCGTGNYTQALAKEGFDFIGIDPSGEILGKARLSPIKIDWRQGHAENTSLQAESMDGILASLSIHHWQNLETAFTELHRVLKKEGQLVIFTSTPLQMEAYWLNHYFPKTLAAATRQMPSLESLEGALGKAGLRISSTEKYFVKPDLQDLFLHSGKHRPELYLIPEVRRGISTFAALADRDEVRKGLARLKTDIEDGSVLKIIETYESEVGDYLFVMGEKYRSSDYHF